MDNKNYPWLHQHVKHQLRAKIFKVEVENLSLPH